MSGLQPECKDIVHHELDLVLTARDRRGIREQVVGYWLAEESGSVSVCHRYRYWVESLSDGSRIYLERPARLNKGIDFVIYCERFLYWRNGNDRPPGHGDLLRELRDLSTLSQEHRREIRESLRAIWDCLPPEEAMVKLVLLQKDLRAERCLKLARWFFVEQDLTYWTESGRYMLRAAIEAQLGQLGEG